MAGAGRANRKGKRGWNFFWLAYLVFSSRHGLGLLLPLRSARIAFKLAWLLRAFLNPIEFVPLVNPENGSY